MHNGVRIHYQLSEVISSQGAPYAMSFAYNASGSISEITDRECSLKCVILHFQSFSIDMGYGGYSLYVWT